MARYLLVASPVSAQEATGVVTYVRSAATEAGIKIDAAKLSPSRIPRTICCLPRRGGSSLPLAALDKPLGRRAGPVLHPLLYVAAYPLGARSREMKLDDTH